MIKDKMNTNENSYSETAIRYKKKEMILPEISMEIEYIMNEYLDYRDVVFIFGAGTSYSDGAILQSQIIPYLLLSENEYMNESSAFKLVVAFINLYFDFDMTLGVFPTLEQV